MWRVGTESHLRVKRFETGLSDASLQVMKK